MSIRDDAQWLIDNIDEAKRMASAVSKPQLGTSSIESGRIEEYDQDGTLVQVIGEQHDGTHTNVTTNGPVPPEPVAPTITTGIGSVEARWSGKFAADALSPMDLSHVSLHASRVEVFSPDNTTQKATITGEMGDLAVILIEPGEWTFGLVAVSKAGKWSEMSETVTVEIPDYPDPVDIQDELIRFDEVTGGLITEAGNLGQRLDQAEADLVNHDGRLEQAETRVDDAFVQIESVDSKSDAAKTAAEEAKTAAATAQGQADTAKSAADQAAADALAAAGLAGSKGEVIYQLSAPTGARANPANLWIRTTDNKPHTYNTTSKTWVAVTDKAATDAASAAADARSRADAAAQAAADAQSAAGTAQQTANSALTMAGTKGKVFYSTSAPSGTGTATGDLWRRVDGSKNVIGEWYWSGSAWQSSQITTTAIANLDVGKLTVGTGVISDLVAQHIAGKTAAFQTVDIKNLFVTTGTMAEAVINKLYADVVMSRKATFQQLAVGDFQNYIPTGLGMNDEPYDWAVGLTPDFVDVPPGLTHSFKNAPGGGNVSSTASFIDVTPGDEYVFEVWVKADKPNSRVFFEMRDQDGAHAFTSTRLDQGDSFWGNVSYPVNNAPVPTVWTKWRAKCVPKPGVRKVRLGTMYLNHPNGTEQGAQVWVAGLSLKRRFGGEVIIDGGVKAKQIDTEDLAANTGFIADLTSRIVKSDMFVGNEFFGGTFIGSNFWTSPLAGVGMKLDNDGLRAYGPDGGEPVAEIRPDGGTVYQVSDPTTGEVLGGIDSEGGVSGTGLAVSGEARIDGVLVMGSDPLHPIALGGDDPGRYGPVFNSRALLATNFQNHVNTHPSTVDYTSWLEMIPFGCIEHGYIQSTAGWGWNGLGGQPHYRIVMGITANLVAGRSYHIIWQAPPFEQTTTNGSLTPDRNIGGCFVRYSAPSGGISANGAGYVLPGSLRYIPGGGASFTPNGTSYIRCPEDIPAGKIMFGIEAYCYAGRSMVTSSNVNANRWSIEVSDVGPSRPYNGSVPASSSQQGTEPTPPPLPPAPDPVREYTDTISASWWQAYTGNNSQATHSTYSGSAAQGYSAYVPGNGIMRGLIGFPSQATRLSGATVKKIEVYVYSKHWHASAGGTACIGVHGHGSKPSSWSSTTNMVTTQKMKRPEGRWITLPSSVHAGFKSGSLKGISFLPPTSSSEYYGIFEGNKTRLRVTYTK